MKTFLNIISVPVLLLAVFGGVAFAAGSAAPADGTLVDLLGPVWSAVTGKNWWLASAAGLIAAVALLKKYAPKGKVQDFINTSEGGAALVLGASFGGALVASLSGATPVPMSLALANDAFHVALTAAGGYVLIGKLFVDRLLNSKWYTEKAPAWLKSVLSVVTWIYKKPGEEIVAEAEKAGEAAVVAKPSTGADSVAGPTTDI